MSLLSALGTAGRTERESELEPLAKFATTSRGRTAAPLMAQGPDRLIGDRNRRRINMDEIIGARTRA